jgi:hypothetical protein
LIKGRDVNNNIAAWLCGIYSIDDALDVPPEHWPLGVAEHDERYSAMLQILLVTSVLVR